MLINLFVFFFFLSVWYLCCFAFDLSLFDYLCVVFLFAVLINMFVCLVFYVCFFCLIFFAYRGLGAIGVSWAINRVGAQ